MAEQKPPDPDEGDLDEVDDYERMREMLDAHLSEFAEEHDLSLGAVSLMLFDIGASMRMSDYVLSVEKPSVSGLKLDLDRCQRELDDLLRDCKRGAEEFVSTSKAMLREMEMEHDPEIAAQDKAEDSDRKQ
jgi:hypothetical protein